MIDLQRLRGGAAYEAAFRRSHSPLACFLACVVWSFAAVAQEAAAPPATPSEPESEVAEEALGATQESVAPPEATDPEMPTGVESIEPPSGVEVIRIKGRAVTAIEAEVPTSVTQFDAGAIEALGVQNIGDLAKVTPNVEIITASATAATFFIRGVGLSDFNANAAGAVAIYMDDVALNAPAIQLGQLFDIENVDVLRGPQGSGSGRNASAGAIKSYSRKPTGTFEARLRTSIGSYWSDDARDALIQDYEGAVEFPLVKEMLAARFAFRLRDSDPYKRNGCHDLPPLEDRPVLAFPLTVNDVSFCGENVLTNQTSLVPAGLPKHVQDEGSWAARGQLRFQPPGTEMDWLLNLHGSRLDQDSTLGQAIGTGAIGESFGQQTSKGYIEPDQAEEFEEIFEPLPAMLFPTFREECEDDPFNNTEAKILICQRINSQVEGRRQAEAILAKNLAEDRPLDRRPYRGDYNQIGRTTLDTWGGFLRGDFSIGRVDVTSISDYEGYSRSRVTDQDFTPNVIFEQDQLDEAWQLSQELRFGGELEDEPLRLEAGGYFLYENLKANVDQQILSNAQSFVRSYEQDTLSLGIWGEFSWDFLDDFTLEGGVRYNYEQKDFDFELATSRMGGTRIDVNDPDKTDRGPDLSDPACPAVPPDECVNYDSWSAPTGTLSLTYRFRENANVYWKYSRGFKAGHFNSSTADDQPADPEYIDSFEIGMNGSWFDNRLTVRSSLFYYKYADYQVFFFEDASNRPPQLVVINADDAEIYGGELDFRIEPLTNYVPAELDGLVLTGRFGWLESEFINFTNTVFRKSPSGLTDIPVVVDYSGNELISSPRFKFSGGAEWTFDLGRWGSIIPRYDFAWSDDQHYSPTEGKGSLNIDGVGKLPDHAVGQKEFWLHNVRLAYRTPEGNIEVAGWIRNIADERYKNYAFDASNFGKVVLNFVGPPRTVGIDFSISW